MITWPSVEPEVRHVLPDVSIYLVGSKNKYHRLGTWLTFEGYEVEVFMRDGEYYVKNKRVTWSLLMNGYFDNGDQCLQEFVGNAINI